MIKAIDINKEVLEIIKNSGCTVEEFGEACHRVSKYWDLIKIQRTASAEKFGHDIKE